jgi:hypothetical protein
VSDTRPYHNEATQSEKRAILKNDSYFARQQSQPDDAGGRYAKIRPSNVTGSAPSQQIPKQPENSPWASDPLGPEPPLGFSVDEMNPVGELHEIEKSLASLEARESNPTTAVVMASPAVEVDRSHASGGRSVVSSAAGRPPTLTRRI